MSDTLTDTIAPFFDNEDIDNFKDKQYKKTFLDKIEKDTGKNRKSIDITFNQILKTKLEESGKNSEDFVKPRAKKFSSKLDVKSNTKKVDINEKEKFPSTQNPKGKLLQERKELPLGAVAGAANSFLGAIFEDLEELTDTEKDDIGVCLNMAFGDYINAHDNARKLMGAVGIMGIYGGKIKTARKHKKKRLEKQEKENPTDKLPEITNQDREEFQKQSQEFIEDKLQSDT